MTACLASHNCMHSIRWLLTPKLALSMILWLLYYQPSKLHELKRVRLNEPNFPVELSLTINVLFSHTYTVSFFLFRLNATMVGGIKRCSAQYKLF